MFCVLGLVNKIIMPYYVDMYVARASWPSANGKSYQSIYLRESYRDGAHVRKRDIANLTHCDPKKEMGVATLERRSRRGIDGAGLARYGIPSRRRSRRRDRSHEVERSLRPSARSTACRIVPCDL